MAREIPPRAASAFATLLLSCVALVLLHRAPAVLKRRSLRSEMLAAVKSAGTGAKMEELYDGESWDHSEEVAFVASGIAKHSGHNLETAGRSTLTKLAATDGATKKTALLPVDSGAYGGPGPCWGPASEITIVTGFIDMSATAHALIKSVRKNRIDYAKRHGYRVCFFDQAETFGFALYWTRINELLELMTSSKWMLWMDADAVFNRFDVALTDILRYGTSGYYDSDGVFTPGNETSAAVHLILTDECLVPHVPPPTYLSGETVPLAYRALPPPPKTKKTTKINDGIFFIDSSGFSIAFLKEISTKKKWANHKEWDQSAIEQYRSDHTASFDEHVRIISHSKINSWSQCLPYYRMYLHKAIMDSFIIHWAGCPMHPHGAMQRAAIPHGKYTEIIKFLEHHQLDAAARKAWVAKNIISTTPPPQLGGRGIN